jgi:hypothetical protein
LTPHAASTRTPPLLCDGKGTTAAHAPLHVLNCSHASTLKHNELSELQTRGAANRQMLHQVRRAIHTCSVDLLVTLWCIVHLVTAYHWIVSADQHNARCSLAHIVEHLAAAGVPDNPVRGPRLCIKRAVKADALPDVMHGRPCSAYQFLLYYCC